MYEGIGDLNKTSFKKILNIIDNAHIDFVVMSGFNPINSTKENFHKNNDILIKLKELFDRKIEAYKLVGIWQKCNNKIEEVKNLEELKNKCKKNGGNIVDFTEEVLFIKFHKITDEILEEILKLAKEFNQDTIIIRRDRIIQSLGNDGVIKQSFNSTNSEEIIKQSFVELIRIEKFKNFIQFFGVAPTTNFGKMAFQAVNLYY